MTISPTVGVSAPTGSDHPVSAAPVVPSTGSRHGVSVDAVDLDPTGFWGRRQSVNRSATLLHCVEWMDRLGWLENFDRVARGEVTTERPGWQFSDSEIYKLLEGMAWELGRQPDPELRSLFTALVARVAAAQDDDGYVGTAFGHPGLPPRYSDLAMGHELYNIGHLIQAGVARARTGHVDALVGMARRAADHVCIEFGPDARDGICGHPEIEVALAELGRALGERRYLDQARLFIRRRGRGSLPVRPLLSAEYFQDDIPVLDAEVLRGHAVRALYLTAGAVDVAVEDDDSELLDATRRQWLRTVERRTYLTGGMGSRHQDEGFGDDWELPADRAYCETCAGVGSVMLAWRLYLATGEAAHVDLIERTLLNVVATSPGDDGRSFFYANPLHQREAASESVDGVNTRAEGGVRAPWFEVSCCPTNVARTLASLGSYAAATDGDTAVLLQYAAGQYRVGGFRLQVLTEYPADGRIAIRILDAPTGKASLRLRVPSWAASAQLVDPDGVERDVAPGWAEIERDFIPGETVTLRLDVSARLTWPDPRIDGARGTVAVERGPIVLCLESHDLPAGVRIEDVRVTSAAEPISSGDGARIAGSASEPTRVEEGSPPFSASRPAEMTIPLELQLVPYHRWAERGPSTMRVFLPLVDA